MGGHRDFIPFNGIWGVDVVTHDCKSCLYRIYNIRQKDSGFVPRLNFPYHLQMG